MEHKLCSGNKISRYRRRGKLFQGKLSQWFDFFFLLLRSLRSRNVLVCVMMTKHVNSASSLRFAEDGNFLNVYYCKAVTWLLSQASEKKNMPVELPLSAFRSVQGMGARTEMNADEFHAKTLSIIVDDFRVMKIKIAKETGRDGRRDLSKLKKTFSIPSNMTE